MIPFALAARWRADSSSKADERRHRWESRTADTDIERPLGASNVNDESALQLETGCEPVAEPDRVRTESSPPPVGHPHLGLALPLEELASPVPPHVPTGKAPSCGGLCTSARVLPVRMDLKDVSYCVSSKGGPGGDDGIRTILSNVNATLEAGQLVAVMGPSGCGKSSLLSLLHGERRYLRGMTSGELLVNGTPLQEPIVQQHYRELCSLVPQEDVLLSSFTVRETLMFSAHLRLPPTKTTRQKASIVQEVITDLSLLDCADTVIGGQSTGQAVAPGLLESCYLHYTARHKMRSPVPTAAGPEQGGQGERRPASGTQVGGISGGQRRRVSIGLEMVVNPSVLLLDEPTSGLDSKTAEDICLLLWMLAKPGRLVVCSIHQPSYSIFSRFDQLCFLVRGQVVYLGPGDHVMQYFTALGFPLPSYENPSDFYMRIMQSEQSGKLVSAWHDRVQARRRRHEKHHPSSPQPTSDVDKAVSLSLSMSLSNGSAPDDVEGKWLGQGLGRRRVGPWKEAALLLRRMLQDSVRDRGKFVSGVAVETMVGLLVGMVWLQQDVHSQASVFPVLGVFIMLTTIAIFDNLVSVCLRFPLSRALHLREFSNGYYQLLPFYAASVTSSLLLSAAYQVPQALLVFFMVGLDANDGKLISYLLILWLAACLGACLGLVVGTRTSDLHSAQQVLTPILMPMMLFSGYMLPYPLIPRWLRWAYHVSPYQHVFSALVSNHLHNLRFHDCYFPAPTASGHRICFSDGDTYLTVGLALPASAPYRNVIAMLAMLVVLVLLGFQGLRRISL